MSTIVEGYGIVKYDLEFSGSFCAMVDADQFGKKKVADAIVETMMNELGCAKEHLSVAVHDVKPEDWNSEIEANVNKDELYAGEVYKA